MTKKQTVVNRLADDRPQDRRQMPPGPWDQPTPPSLRREARERAGREVERPAADPPPQSAPARKPKRTDLTDEELARIHVRSRHGVVRTPEENQRYQEHLDTLATRHPKRHRHEYYGVEQAEAIADRWSRAER